MTTGSFWEKFFDWLERVLPSVLASFVAGYRFGKRGKSKEEAKLARLEYELKKKIIFDEVRKKYVGKSDDDIINEFLSDDQSGKGQ